LDSRLGETVTALIEKQYVNFYCLSRHGLE